MVDKEAIKKEVNAKEEIKKRLESSSIIIFPNILKSDFYLVKFVWLICFLMSTSWCGWFVFRTCADYLSHNVVTKTLVKHQTGLIFPIIGICNINPFTTEYAKSFVRSVTNTEKPQKDDFYNSIVYANYLKNTTRFDRRKFGLSLDEFIIDCSFAYVPCNLSNDFEYYYDVNYGNCFRYNSDKNMNDEITDQYYVYASGIYSALELELFIGSAFQNTYPFSVENGLVLFINNQSVDSTYSEGINIAAGTSTRVILSSYTNKRQAKPYS